MSDDYVNLHSHGTYSYLDGYGHPSQFVTRVQELGQTALGMTDHGNVSCHYKTSVVCKKAGIKPVLGLEAYVCDDATIKDNEHKRSWHVTLWARNTEGYRNLLKIVTQSYELGFYYKPRTDWATLKANAKGLIASSGCPSGKIGRGITYEHWDQAKVVAEMKRQAGLFEDGAYYAEVIPLEYENGIEWGRSVYKSAVAAGVPMILTRDAHYPRPEDASTQDIMLCIGNNAKFNDPERMKFSQQDFYISSGAEMAEKWHKLHGKVCPGLDDMILNTKRIADSIDFAFPTATHLSFDYKGDKSKLLRKLCDQGMKDRGLVGKPGYKERLDYEFKLVKEKDFTDYFLVVSDMIRWAKRNGILVGAARGSSCGSLMCYLTDITDIDPLRFNLLFERFIDVSRIDPPDIDVDFESERRDEVKSYLEQKYGQDHVAQLATFATFKGRLCLQDVGRVFSDTIPTEVIDAAKKMIIQRSAADSRSGFAVEDTFKNFTQAAEYLKQYPELGHAQKLEGQIRQLGVHAAGVVISNDPIGNFAAMYVTKNKDRVISMDGPDASAVGLLKIDILGLTALTTTKHILATIKERHGIDLDRKEIPLDDKEVYKAFCDQRLEGIFQFEGFSTKQVCRQVQPENFEHLTAINALSRPGPLHSGSTTAFIARRHGKEEAEPIHPSLKTITNLTYGIIVYQEQVMQVVRGMGKFDWADTAAVRKAMSKKLGVEYFDKMKAKFVAGASGQGVDEASAFKAWANVCTHGIWSFNRSHAVAYTVMAYRMMWLKVHYTAEFYAASISCETDAAVQRNILREAKSVGQKILPVCINRSTDKVLSCDDGGLRLGLPALVGITTKTMEAVVKCRPYSSVIDFNRRCKVTPKQSDVLLKVGAFRDLNCKSISAQGDLFGADKAEREDFSYKEPKDADVREFCPLAADDKACAEAQAWFANEYGKKVWAIRELESTPEKVEVLIIGRTNSGSDYSLKNKMEGSRSRGEKFDRKRGEEEFTERQYDFLNFNMDDGTAMIIVRVSHKQYPKFKDMIWKVQPTDLVAVKGMYNGVQWMHFAFQIINLTQLRRKLASGEKLDKFEAKFIEDDDDWTERPERPERVSEGEPSWASDAPAF